MNITSFPALFGIFALSFLLLLTAKVIKQPAEDKTAKQLLILLLTGLIALTSCTFYYRAGIQLKWPRLSNIEIGFVYWIGPSLYFYIKRLAGGPGPFANPLNLLHWLPAILVELILIPYYLMPLEDKITYLGRPHGTFMFIMRTIWLLFHVQLLIYIFFCQPQLRSYKRRIADNHSDISAFNLRWLGLLCYGFIGQILVERLLPLLESTPRSLSGSSMMVAYLFVIAMAYLALGQSRLQFANGWRPSRGNGKYYRSGLRDDSAQYYLDKLNAMMKAERSYLDSDLTLQSLAEGLKISPHHLSQILNEKLEKNFYDYINEQRVNYAKQLLLQESRQSITDIAFESGYNSKKSFYNAFKRHAGMAPSDFRLKAHQSRASSPETY